MTRKFNISANPSIEFDFPTAAKVSVNIGTIGRIPHLTDNRIQIHFEFTNRGEQVATVKHLNIELTCTDAANHLFEWVWFLKQTGQRLDRENSPAPFSISPNQGASKIIAFLSSDKFNWIEGDYEINFELTYEATSKKTKIAKATALFSLNSQQVSSIKAILPQTGIIGYTEIKLQPQ